MARSRITPSDDVRAWLQTLAAQANAQGYIEVTDDLVCALETAVWKLEQERDPVLLREWQEDRAYRYERCR